MMLRTILMAALALWALGAYAGPGDLDFFLGDWEIESTNVMPDGSYAESTARSSARKILDGTAMLDEWRSLDGAGNVVFRGATFRTYLPREDRWQIVWLMANVKGTTDIEAHWNDGELTMEGTGYDPGGAFVERARYHDISENSFSFTMERSYDDGETWISPFNAFTATRSH